MNSTVSRLRRSHLVLLAVVWMIGSGTLLGQEIQWRKSLDDALLESEGTGKPVLLHFSADWCRPCQELKKYVLSDTKVIRTVNSKVIPVQIDMDLRADLVKQYAVTNIPTDVFVDHKARVLHRSNSPARAEAWLEMMTQVLQRAVAVDENGGSATLEKMAELQRKWEESRAEEKQTEDAEQFAIEPFHLQKNFSPLEAAPGNDAASQLAESSSRRSPTARQFVHDAMQQANGQNPPAAPDAAAAIDANTGSSARRFEVPQNNSGNSSESTQIVTGHQQIPFTPAPISAAVPANSQASAPPQHAATTPAATIPAATSPESSPAVQSLAIPGATPHDFYASSLADTNVLRPASVQEPVEVAPVLVTNPFLGANGNFACGNGASTAANAPPQDSFSRPISVRATVTEKAIQSHQNAAESKVVNQFAPPAMGLDGFCPVSLLRDGKWVPGDAQIGCMHRGQAYLFASEDIRNVFIADPDRYSPLLAGHDPVTFQRTGRLVGGHRKFGVFMGDGSSQQVVLFENETTQAEFKANSDKYLESVRIATEQADGSANRTVR